MQNIRSTLNRVGNLGNFSISMPNLAQEPEKSEAGPVETLQVPQYAGPPSCQSSVQGKRFPTLNLRNPLYSHPHTRHEGPLSSQGKKFMPNLRYPLNSCFMRQGAPLQSETFHFEYLRYLSSFPHLSSET